MAPVISVSPTTQDVSKALAVYVRDIAAAAVKERGKFTVALSGGSLPSILAAAVSLEPDKSDIDWSKWHVVFADERFVPLDHADSNYLSCSRALFDKVPIPQSQIYTLNYHGTVNDGAVEYEGQLRRLLGNETPALDLVLLGMGEDGHTCSLFPGHSLLDERQHWVRGISDSPKPPPERITVTYAVLDAARHTAFVCTGQGKAMVVANIFNDGNSGKYPAGMIRPKAGDTSITWFLDSPAASELNQ